MVNEIDAQLKAKFEDAVKRSDNFPSQSTNVQLELYSFYKQALFGDATGERPERMKIRERAKFDEWTKRQGMSKEDAMKQYIELVNRLESSLK
ncbi:MAG TPA: acyl-CoA-binding protein [Candidatus Deferrimicrobium sp.]|nr:acyl-CoA-binding protein [Candidatus Deferrimicrobium sp.]